MDRNLIQFQYGTFSTAFSNFYESVLKDLQTLSKDYSLKSLLINRGLIKNKDKKKKLKDIFYRELDSGGGSKILSPLIPKWQLRGLVFPNVRFQKKSTILYRIKPYLTLLRYKNDLMSVDELRSLFNEVGIVKNSIFDIPAPLDKAILRSTIDACIIDVLKVMLKKTSAKADEISKKMITPSTIPPFYGHELIEPLRKGYNAIKIRLDRFVNTFLSDPGTHISQILDLVLAFDNDIFTNREGSSRTKKMNSFNRMARLIIDEIGRIPEKYRPPKNIPFVNLGIVNNPFLFKSRLKSIISNQMTGKPDKPDDLKFDFKF